MALSDEEGEHIGENGRPYPGYGEPGLCVQNQTQNDEHCLKNGEDQSEEEVLFVCADQSEDGVGRDQRCGDGVIDVTLPIVIVATDGHHCLNEVHQH